MDTEQALAYAPQLTVENWIAITATILTFAIAATALLQWRWSRIAHMQSHTPIIRTDFGMPNETHPGYVEITNSGLGPALLKEINIYMNGEAITAHLSIACEHIIEKLGRDARGHVEITKKYDYQQGYPVSRDESLTIIEFNLKGVSNYDIFESEMIDQGVQIEVICHDIFGRRHVALDPRPGKAL